MLRKFKSDKPARKIKAALEEVGATVFYIRGVPKRGKKNGGEPDLCVGFLGVTFLLEVKDTNGKISEEQIRFHSEWRGRKISVVRNETEALIAIGLVV